MLSDKVFNAIEYLPRKANSYVRALARLKAYETDPKFREIEDKRHANGTLSTIVFFGNGLGIEDWIYQSQKTEDLTPSLRHWQTLQEWSQKPRAWEGKTRRALQRARKGYDEWAVFDFRSWHATHVALALQEFRDNLHSHPADRSAQQWEQDLDEVIAKFRLISSGEPSDDQQAIDDAMASLARVYLHLWD